MPTPHTLLLVDDHALFRAGVRALLSSEPDLEIVGEADNGVDAVHLACTLKPSLVLMDLNMPGAGGLSAIVEIKQQVPTVKMLVVTAQKTVEHIQQALRGGASGYILKESGYAEFRSAISTVLAGKVYLSPDVSERVVSGFIMHSNRSGPVAAQLESLTSRERETLNRVGQGHSNKDIAQSLNLSIKTVEKHRSSLMRKLGLHNVASLIAYAIQHGVVKIPSD